MSYQTLTTFQKRLLWSLACNISQGPALYDEDHAYDDERSKIIDSIELIVNTPEPLEPKL